MKDCKIRNIPYLLCEFNISVFDNLNNVKSANKDNDECESISVIA